MSRGFIGVLSVIISFVFGMLVFGSEDFFSGQLDEDRVKEAFKEKKSKILKMLKKKNLNENNYHTLLVAIKESRDILLYVRHRDSTKYELLSKYKICKSSGIPGPKRRSGDKQVPEGFYYIKVFNPQSRFYLSLGINYPNKSDSIRGYAPDLGGDIYIHGGCYTLGCLPVTDDLIKEIYPICLLAAKNGQSKIPVYIFPFEMNKAKWKQFSSRYSADKKLIDFWKELKVGYDKFEQNYEEIDFEIDGLGKYIIENNCQ